MNSLEGVPAWENESEEIEALRAEISLHIEELERIGEEVPRLRVSLRHALQRLDIIESKVAKKITAMQKELDEKDKRIAFLEVQLIEARLKVGAP